MTSSSSKTPQIDLNPLIQAGTQYLNDKRKQLDRMKYKINITRSHIINRSIQMMRDLWDIYPIVEFPDGKGYSICDIHLPSTFEGHNETMVNVAIGYVSHLIKLLGDILDIILRFPLKYNGSKSFIYCSRREQLFPLFVSREFSYGLKLLNLNIVQIRTQFGLVTDHPDETLANLYYLRRFFEGTADDTRPSSPTMKEP